ncbi:MAG: zinc ribbon domain-containing protein [Bacillota bacterium]|nr:zinc ribbon domain-containing protein [Bacillota bacterium]
MKCKSCGQEILPGASYCQHCGKDQRSFFGKHKILTGVSVAVIIFIIFVKAVASKYVTYSNSTAATAKNTSTSNKNDVKNKIAPTATPKPTLKPKPTATPKVKKYSNGTYLVNKDIPSGLYKVTLKDSMGYIERAKDVTMNDDDIIANIMLTGNGYVEILSTDTAVKLQGVEIEPITLTNLKPNIKDTATDGIYLVGYDLAPGTYKVELTDESSKIGYIERSKSVTMDLSDIIANETEQGPGYVKIEQGDFAVKLQGVKITIQK